MLKNQLKQIFLFIAIIFSITSIQAQTNKIPKADKSLRVGIAGTEPFVFSDNDKGIAVEIWDKIANAQDWDYKYVRYGSVDQALQALKNDEIDLVAGPISITANRIENMRFSQPFYNSSISIISKIENPSLWQKVKPLFSFKLIIAIFVFLIILSIVGTFFWLAERKASPEQFPQKPLDGIGTGMWLAIVTMSTTGYGDKAPITVTGRIIAGSWMIISIIFATSMVAGIASTLTLSSMSTKTITSIEQLSNRKVATISGSPADSFISKYKAKVIGVSSLSEAIKQLENEEVDAVVYDRPQLLYYLKNHEDEHLFISKAEYYKQGYGFAFAKNSELIFDVNRTLLELTENQETQRIIHNYIQKDE